LREQLSSRRRSNNHVASNGTRHNRQLHSDIALQRDCRFLKQIACAKISSQNVLTAMHADASAFHCRRMCYHFAV
jgi:hypothetical protein